jgi:3,4-dihydroxy 2-butanone 4-phosphate synthase/GTP cyclohydrolase II
MSIPDIFPDLQETAQRHFSRTGRPLVTLSYAQSMDGSISHQRGEPMSISGPDSLHFTHQLRDLNDAILVGIGTVLADDPRLTVRSLNGRDPQPVVLDSRLRFPDNARLWDHPRPPWIFASPGVDADKKNIIADRGGAVHEIPPISGRYLNLNDLLDQLGKLGIQSLMVEGGASVITNFLSLGLVNRAVITIAPFFLGGLGLLESRLPVVQRLQALRFIQLGEDIVVYGSFEDSPDED